MDVYWFLVNNSIIIQWLKGTISSMAANTLLTVNMILPIGMHILGQNCDACVRNPKVAVVPFHFTTKYSTFFTVGGYASENQSGIDVRIIAIGY